MTILRRFLIAFGAAAVVACAPVDTPAETPPMNSNVEIRLTRGVCFGFCPDYTVTINGEGQVRYEGRRFVNAVGERTATIPREDVARLVAPLRRNRLRPLARRLSRQTSPICRPTRSRSPATVKPRPLWTMAAPAPACPQAVRDLQAEIDRVAGTAQWVLRDGQPVRDRPQP